MQKQVQIFRSRANLEERARLSAQLREEAEKMAEASDKRRRNAYYAVQELRAKYPGKY